MAGAKRIIRLEADVCASTLVYVEGDAKMQKYESKEGRTESALSIVQRETDMIPYISVGGSSDFFCQQRGWRC
jgi:single-stranded DNA-binding protein